MHDVLLAAGQWVTIGFCVAASIGVTALPAAAAGEVRVAILDFRTGAIADAFRASLDRELAQAFHASGRRVAIEYRAALTTREAMHGAAAEAAALRPAVVYATSLVIAAEYRAIDKATPMVFSGAADPLGFDVIDSLARPGRRTTGFVVFGDLETKRLEILRQAIPSVSRVALLFDPAILPADSVARKVTAAQAIGIELLPIRIDQPLAELERRLRESKPDAADVPTSNALRRNAQGVIDLLRRLSLPSSFYGEDFVRLGGLFSYGPADIPFAAKAAELVRLIVDGQDAGEIPVEISKQFVLAINLTTASRLQRKPVVSFLKRANSFYR